MRQRILTPTKYPVARIPIFSGGASGEIYCRDHDPAYGSNGNYFAPFGIATKEGTSGQSKLEAGGIEVYVHKKRPGMTREQWTDGLVDLVEARLPPGYSMDEALLLLTGCDEILKGEQIETVIGPRKINVHPAPLHILTHPDTGEIVNVYGLSPAYVNQYYIKKGFSRRYVGWGEKIMPKILKEQQFGAATVHIADPEIDHGPCIATKQKQREPEHFVRPGAFQDELKDEGDGPCIVAATHMILGGLEIKGKTLHYNGQEVMYQGLSLSETNWESQLEIDSMND